MPVQHFVRFAGASCGTGGPGSEKQVRFSAHNERCLGK
jgi:hypothetical protein